MRRICALACLCLTLLGVLALLVTRAEAGPELIRIAAPGVWFREGDRDQGHSNNVIIDMKDYLIVVDANYPSGARSLMQDVKRISTKPVKFVFDTHHHGDHSYGNALWTQAGATTMAFQGVADEMKRFEPARWLRSATNRPDVAELHRDAPEPPKEDIREELFVLNDGSRKVEFRHFGWGHTRGDGYVYLPKEQVLATGDAVVNGPFNNLMDADIGNWPVVLRAVDRLKVKVVLPGHGPMGGREVLTGQEQFLTELYKAVKAGIDQGKKLEEIQASLKLPESVSNWVGETSLKRQAADCYAEITQGKPRGDLPQ